MPNCSCPTSDDEDVVFERRRNGFLLSDDRNRLDLDRICTWLASSYWANDRSRSEIERSVANSRCYGVFDASGQQVAVARATTDDVSFCWIGDVFVDESARGRGIGTWLVGALVEHIRSFGVKRFLLGTRDAHGVYAKLGFSPLLVPEVFMELDERPNRPTYEVLDPAVRR